MGRIDWRARRRSVELPGARVNYVEIGEGEPLLFVHGLSGCWQKLGLEGTMVVGNSMGSFIAVEAMAAFPQRFKRLVLVSAAGILNTWNSEERATVTGYAWKKLGPLVADRGREIVSRRRQPPAGAGAVLPLPEQTRRSLDARTGRRRQPLPRLSAWR